MCKFTHSVAVGQTSLQLNLTNPHHLFILGFIHPLSGPFCIFCNSVAKVTVKVTVFATVLQKKSALRVV